MATLHTDTQADYTQQQARPQLVHTLVMLNMYPRHQLQASSVVDDGDENVVDADDGYGAFYGYAIAVVCVTLFVFCVLVSTVSVWKACAFATLAALLLSVAGCFAPGRWFRRSRSGQRGAGTGAELVVVTVTATAATARPPGYPCAQVTKAPPAFAFQCPVEPAAAAAAVVCSVCLEDVRGGEMVRQVPACRHVFHVGCIDMWLHSHRTCPMCRCVVSPVAKVTTTKDAAAEAAPASPEDHELPPV